MGGMYLITGATGGLGKAFAVECASRGWDLFLTDMREDRLALLAEGLRNAYGVHVLTHACDLTDVAERNRFYEVLHSRGLRFQGLVNVAGIDFEGLFHEQSRERIRMILRLNIEATVDVTHYLLGRMAPTGLFRIITVSSLAAYYPMPVKATYAASKRFLLDFFSALRYEIAGYGATVTILCPAGLPTTERCIHAIEAQGLAGSLTTQNVGYVAARTVDRALQGRAVYIPGWANQMIQFLGSLVPRSSVTWMIGRRWRAANKRSTETFLAEQRVKWPAELAA